MTSAQTDTVRRPDGSTIAFEVQGAPNAPALVLSNSLATDRAMWQRVLPALTARYRVVRYDTRGHGQSRSATAAATLDDLADDLLAVLDTLGLQQVWLAGVSLGGMTALTLALRHPQRLRGLLACHCRDHMDAHALAGWKQRLALMQQQGVAALVGPTLERWFAADVRAAEPALMGEVGAMIGRTTPAGYAACVHAIQGVDLHASLSQLAVPTVYLAGAQDGAAPAAVMQDMAARTPGARCEVFDPCGHLSPLQQPERFVALLTQCFPTA